MNISIFERYLKWIEENYPTRESAYLKCADATERMKTAFPELIRVRGYFVAPFVGERNHWWLVTEDGEIVDPTMHQFECILVPIVPCHLKDFYIPIDEENFEEPVGKCMNCGVLCFPSRGGDATTCSDECRCDLDFSFSERYRNGPMY